MKSRREFLKDAAAGAVALGASVAADGLGLAGKQNERTPAGKSRVVVARDAALHGAGGQPDEKRVLALLDKAMAAYTGREHLVEAWKHVIPAEILSGKVIGLKVNGLGGRGISTHRVLVMAIAERLQQAGVRAGNIVVWDRNARDLEACGMTISTNANGIRCYGNDSAGFEDQPASFGSARVRLSRILTRDCAMVISLPILKDHDMSGLTFTMKNMYGVVERPNELHGNNCNPGVADLNCIPAVRNKVRFTIGDALTSVYQGGPTFHPAFMWYPNALVVGEDRVAIDHTALQMLNQKRVEAGLGTLEADGRTPQYIATAADRAHRLGTNDPKRIHLMEI
ncbi:MAG: DUF362 domain-containing protein [Acidobacteriota bacterium]